MWEQLNLLLLILELLVLLSALGFCIHKKRATMPLVLGCMIAVLAFSAYCLPTVHHLVAEQGLQIEKTGHWLLDTMSIFHDTAKMFVGEFNTDKVFDYTRLYPWYALNFFLVALLSLWTSFSVAIHIFGYKVRNWNRRKKYFSSDVCDLVIGTGVEALQYAKNNPNTVLMPSETVSKDEVASLMEDGYTILKRGISAEFLKSRYFNDRTQYHIIYLDETLDLFYEINQICEYLKSEDVKNNIHFYLEAKENTLEIIQQQIDLKDSQDQESNQKQSKIPYRDFLTVFSRYELVARTFTEQHPITQYLPKEFITEDTSMKETVSIRMFFLGFSSLSKEIYRSSVINNQLAVYRNGEYQLFPIEYHIYDDAVPEQSWEIAGIRDSLKILSENADSYFPMPELPYHTCCHEQLSYGMDGLRRLCEFVKTPDSYNYFVIDTGDLYRNLELSNQLQLLLNDQQNYHIFLYHSFLFGSVGKNVTFYGNLKHILTHNILVDESLLSLAKTIDKQYLKQYKDSLKQSYTDDSLEKESLENWKKTSYFNRYSNIYLANNLRLKLNLLGLDYTEDSLGENLELFPQQYNPLETGNCTLTSYQERNVKNALLAQEHFRWNAYHLLSGYLPMKKERVLVEVEKNSEEGSITVKTKNKNNAAKKHACLTTYRGVGEISSYLAREANRLIPGGNYRPENFDYYKYDEMLLNVAPAFLEKEKYSLKRR